MAEGVTAEEVTNSCVDVVNSAAAGDGTSSLPRAALFIIGELLNQLYVPALLSRIVTGLSSFNNNIDVTDLLRSLSSQQPIVSIVSSDEKVLEWTNDNASLKVLVYPSTKLARKSIQQILSIKTSKRFVLYSGHTVLGTGTWLLRDGSLSYQDVTNLFQTASEIVGETEISTFLEGDWTVAAQVKKNTIFQLAEVKKDAVGNEQIQEFVHNIIAPHISTKSVTDLLTTSKVVGVVPFHRPTVYIFQGGDGVSSVFGVRGFTLLVDGGYAKQTSCWDFIRHLDNVDAMLISHFGVDNLLGLASLFERYSIGDVQTSLGVVYCNTTGSGNKVPGENGKSTEDSELSLPLCLKNTSLSVLEKVHQKSIPLLKCTGNASGQPINLYHKIGFGSLDMYVLNPLADSKEIKDLHTSWGKSSKSNASDANLQNLTCIATVIVFKPAGTGERPVRILFPGSNNQNTIFAGLERLKSVTMFQSLSGLSNVLPSRGYEKPTVRPATVINSNRPAISSSVLAPAVRISGSRPTTTDSTKTISTKPPATSTDGIVSKTETKDSKRPVSSSGDLVRKEKKPPAIDQQKSGDAKDVKPSGDSKDVKQTSRPAMEPKKTDPKEHKTQLPTTSTPKKDSPKLAPSKIDAIKKNDSTLHGAVKKNEDSSKKLVQKSGAPASSSDKQSIKKEAVKSTKQQPASGKIVVDEKVTNEPSSDGQVSGEQAIKSELVEGHAREEAVPLVVSGGVSEQEPVVSVEADVQQNIAAVAAEDSASVAVESESAVELLPNGADNADGAKNVDEVARIPAPELDPISNWEPPQSLPLPADDKNDYVVESSLVLPLAPGENTAGSKHDSNTATTAISAGQQTAKAVKQPADSANGKEVSKAGSATARSGSAQNGKKVVLKQPDSKPTKSILQPATSNADPVKSVAGQTVGSASVKSSSSAVSKPVTPFYFDLAYIPVKVATNFSVEFFRRVRAQRYVLPGAEASCRALELLAEAKASWEGDVSLIPTGDVEQLTSWLATHQEELTKLHITVEPSVTSCTMSLEHATSCSAFRVEL